MKVFVVTGNNGESYEDNRSWTDAVCASREAAEQWISRSEERYRRDNKRLDELVEKWSETELTDAEDEELIMLQERLYDIHDFDIVSYRITEYDLIE